MFHGIVKNIQLHKKILHGYIYYQGLIMTKQMKNESKLNKFYLPINVNCTMTDLLQHYCKTFDKIQLFISKMNVSFQKIMLYFFHLWHDYQSLVMGCMFP